MPWEPGSSHGEGRRGKKALCRCHHHWTSRWRDVKLRSREHLRQSHSLSLTAHQMREHTPSSVQSSPICALGLWNCDWRCLLFLPWITLTHVLAPGYTQGSRILPEFFNLSPFTSQRLGMETRQHYLPMSLINSAKLDMRELYMASLKISPESPDQGLKNMAIVLCKNQAESFMRNGLDIQ